MKKTVIFLLVLLSACAPIEPRAKAGAKMGLVGSAIGAGTGALVGSVIANGDVPASAMLGATVGLPIGVMIGLYMYDEELNKALRANNTIIIKNRDEIVTRRKMIEDLREDLFTESQEINRGTSFGSPLYTGPTIGTYR